MSTRQFWSCGLQVDYRFLLFRYFRYRLLLFRYFRYRLLLFRYFRYRLLLFCYFRYRFLLFRYFMDRLLLFRYFRCWLLLFRYFYNQSTALKIHFLLFLRKRKITSRKCTAINLNVNLYRLGPVVTDVMWPTITVIQIQTDTNTSDISESKCHRQAFS